MSKAPTQNKPFAKLFGTDAQQILVKLDHSNEMDAPEVRFFFQPPNLGVCSVAIKWDDNSDASWDSAETLLETIKESRVRELVDEQLKTLSEVCE